MEFLPKVSDRFLGVLASTLVGGVYGAFVNQRRARAAGKDVRLGTLITGFLAEGSEWGVAMFLQQLIWTDSIPEDLRPLEPLVYLMWVQAILPKFY